MYKHGNTLSTGDKVKHASAEGKTAGAEGTVTGADPENGSFGVTWQDGTTTWHQANELEKAGS